MPKRRTDFEKALDIIESLKHALEQWVEIQDDEDARESDAETLAAAARILVKHGRKPL